MQNGVAVRGFVDALEPSARAEAEALPDLAARLAGVLAAARMAWPALAVDDAAFLVHVAARIATPLAAALERLPAADLYLACACTLGAPAALRAFENRHAADVDAALARSRIAPALADEVKQRLRIKLFTSIDGGAPRIAEYTGRGELRGWLRVAAVREALNALRSTRREVALDDDAELVDLAGGDDPALAHMKTMYRGELRRAVQEAMPALTPRERNLLRQYYLDGLTFEKLATMYRVHLATVARWVEKAREALLDHSRRALEARLSLGGREVESILRLIESQLDVSAIDLL